VRGLSAPDLEAAGAQQVLEHVAERFGDRAALACSFQKEESVLLDMVMRLGEPRPRVFTLDTGALFPETYATWRAFEQRFGLRVEVVDVPAPDGGPWSADRCCSNGAKAEALDRALEGLEAWITGLRREQAPTRAAAPKLAWDAGRGLWKANPLADWSEQDVWRYIGEHEVPYNPLHDRGYDSIGCAPCTLPGSGREGRWAGSDKLECGLHGQD
jgi:phosphoadenosine phosphosulfate reductase